MKLSLPDGRSAESASNRRYALVLAHNDEAAFVARRSNDLDALRKARAAARRKAHVASVRVVSALFDLRSGEEVQ